MDMAPQMNMIGYSTTYFPDNDNVHLGNDNDVITKMFSQNIFKSFTLVHQDQKIYHTDYHSFCQTSKNIMSS